MKISTRLRNHILPVVFSLVLALGMVPIAAFAVGGEASSSNAEQSPTRVGDEVAPAEEASQAESEAGDSRDEGLAQGSGDTDRPVDVDADEATSFDVRSSDVAQADAGLLAAGDIEVTDEQSLNDALLALSGDAHIRINPAGGTLVLTDTVAINTPYNLIISSVDGTSQVNIQAPATKLHFNVAAAGSITFDHINFVSSASGNGGVKLVTATASITDSLFNITKDNAVEMQGASLTVENSSFLGGSKNGITGGTALTVNDSDFTAFTASAAVTNFKDGHFEGSSFTGNKAGIIVNAAKAVVENSYFYGNSYDDYGSSIRVQGANNDLTVDGSTFEANRITWYGAGAGIGGKIVSGDFKIKNSYFLGNTSAKGGVIGFDQVAGTISVDNCVFEDNSTGLEAWAYSDGAAFFLYNQNAANHIVTASIQNSTFINNTAHDDGGAIFYQAFHPNSSLLVQNNTFVGNTAQQTQDPRDSTDDASGGAIQISLQSKVDIINNTFYDNTSGNTGGAIGVYGDSPNVSGSHRRPTLNLVNNLFVGNTSTEGSALNKDQVDTDPTGVHPSTVYADGNVGLDDGTPLAAGLSAESVFGSASPTLSDTSIAVGSAMQGTVALPVLLIANHGSTALPGTWADGAGVAVSSQGIAAPALDQRGVTRGNPPSAGSIEARYTVSFDSLGGSAVSPVSNLVAGSVVTKPADPTLADSVFENWYTEPTYENLYDFSTPVSSDKTIYAKWSTPAAELYEVTFESNGGSPIEPILDVSSGSLIGKPTDPTRADYAFLGWFKDAAFADAWDFAADTVMGNTTLYANWEPAGEPIVTPEEPGVPTVPGTTDKPSIPASNVKPKGLSKTGDSSLLIAASVGAAGIAAIAALAARRRIKNK